MLRSLWQREAELKSNRIAPCMLALLKSRVEKELYGVPVKASWLPGYLPLQQATTAGGRTFGVPLHSITSR